MRDLKVPTTRGGAVVIPLYQLGSYEPSFVTTFSELELLDNLIDKYTRTDGGEVVKDLEKLKTIIETGLS